MKIIETYIVESCGVICKMYKTISTNNSLQYYLEYSDGKIISITLTQAYTHLT